LKVEQEATVWLCAAAHYREYLVSVVNDAVISYHRKPGLDSLTRIYEQDVGATAFAVLERALPKANVQRTDSSYIHVRQQLRSHVTVQVLKRLVDDQAASAELRDTLFAIDLGL
jgi:lipopolysaccharide biosynthesis regulator YciM